MPALSSVARFLAVLALNLALRADGVKGSQYLYLGDKDTDPVIEYQGTDAASSSVYPRFLNSTDQGPRVVEFYAPWCPHCQHFKPTYVKYARDVTATAEGSDVRFYAVSCTAHNNICRDQGVSGYPTVKAFKAGESEGEKIKYGNKLAVDLILSTLGLRSGKEAAEVRNSKDYVKKSSKEVGSDNTAKEKAALTQEEIAASAYKRTKADILSDASLSLDFTFRNSIFISKGPLSDERKTALFVWLDLLKYALPMDMKESRDQVEALTRRFFEIVKSEDALKESISHVRLERDDWSIGCTHGHPHKGYACGLWDLLHIVSVGVVETNEGKSASEKVATADAAVAMRNFIEHFFGCEECRKNFTRMYDQCMFGRCDRLSTDASLPREKSRELPLWLWETHNAVNVMLLHERSSRDHKPSPTKEEENDAKWPRANECYHCWNGDGTTWDKDEVYMYLKSEYWTAPFKRPKLRQRLKHLITHEGEFVDSSMALLSHSFILPLLAMLIIGIFWALLQKQRKDERLGMSKKRDLYIQ